MAVATGEIETRRSLAGSALKCAGIFWFAAAVLGQWAFFIYIMGFYGASSVSGDFEVWNRLSALGRTPFVRGDTGGNYAYLAHALGAGFIAFGGALQLMPFVRRRFPTFHRWNGRVFLFMVTALSLSGFYLVWVRNTSPSFLEGLSTTINGVLILSFAFLALRAALRRDFASHQRWATRLWLVSNAQWFLRVGVFGYFVANGLIGREASFGEPFFRFWTWGCFLAPLAMLQLYYFAQAQRSGALKYGVAGALAASTLFMGLGIFAFSIFSYALMTGAPLRVG
ncbi:MAG: DUF2306 domain-containing protein [Hyphomonadaceae bacterium]